MLDKQIGLLGDRRHRTWLMTDCSTCRTYKERGFLLLVTVLAKDLAPAPAHGWSSLDEKSGLGDCDRKRRSIQSVDPSPLVTPLG